ncbi:hypothetical protein I4U23_007856 [Adineta vaga]|nr:hypothetical protein I4U23_007856 [Adineta vaga]
MTSRQVEDKSAKSSQNQASRLGFFKFLRPFLTYLLRYIIPGEYVAISDTQNHSKSIISEPDYSLNKDQNVMKYWKKNQKDLEENYGSYLLAKTNTKKRISRYYSINNNRTILIILQGDITRTVVDAIVNAANEHMTGGSGVDGMIHRAAGDMLRKACVAHKEVEYGVRLPTGRSRILLSYNMSSTTYYIINTAGPIYNRGAAKECAKQLSSCYKTALDLANLYDLESIGFTAISCGIFGYPANDGADVALRTIDKHADSLPVVVFVLWDDHIYDAWVKKAEELELTPFDPESSVFTNPTKHVTDDKDEKDTTDQSKTSDDESKSTSTFNKNIIDLSTTDRTEEKTQDGKQDISDDPPTTPHELSDSQKTQNLDSNQNSMDVENNQQSQTTMEIGNANSQNEEEEKEKGTDGETKRVTNEDSKQGTDEEKTDNDEKLHHVDRPSTVMDTPEHHD